MHARTLAAISVFARPAHEATHRHLRGPCDVHVHPALETKHLRLQSKPIIDAPRVHKAQLDKETAATVSIATVKMSYPFSTDCCSDD